MVCLVKLVFSVSGRWNRAIFCAIFLSSSLPLPFTGHSVHSHWMKRAQVWPAVSCFPTNRLDWTFCQYGALCQSAPPSLMLFDFLLVTVTYTGRWLADAGSCQGFGLHSPFCVCSEARAISGCTFSPGLEWLCGRKKAFFNRLIRNREESVFISYLFSKQYLFDRHCSYWKGEFKALLQIFLLQHCGGSFGSV